MKEARSRWWEVLFTKNPMMAEVSRFRKRFLSIRGSSVAINGGVGIVLVLYALFSMVCVYYRGDFDPIILITIFAYLMLFAIPLMLHASIAGERERRSWDMLLVAPITHGQIIVGKFAGALSGLFLAFGLYLIPVSIDAAFNDDKNVGALLVSGIVVLAQGAMLIALTLLISSRVKRPLIALAVSIGVVMVYFFFLPGLSMSLFSGSTRTLTGIVSPFEILQRLSRIGQNGSDNYDPMSVQILDPVILVSGHLFFQLAVTISLLVWATKTLVFADHEVKFIRTKRNHA